MTAPFGDLAAGATLGRYELLLPVAQGGMAQVWAARLKGTRGFSKTVAIKTMLPALSADPRFEKMFLSEAELASRIKHPNVCEILDLGEHGGVLYLVMEWIDGESLVTLAHDCERAGRAIPYEVATRLVLDAARGLHAAHELKDDEGQIVGVVHRDVSPHNILVTYDGHVKIVDFGVAKAVARADHQPTHSGHLKGKVPYMAPEQVYGDELDRRADIFALGIVLYQLTTGEHPFRSDNELATLARITSPDPVPAPDKLSPAYPPELASVVMKALAKDREQRYATMAELEQDLEAVLGAFSVGGRVPRPETFVREVLGPRAATRAATLKAAARAADEQASRAGGLGQKVPDENTGAPVTMGAERKAGRGVAMAAALAIGVGLGAAALLLWGRSGAPPAAPIGVPATQVGATSEVAPAVSAAGNAGPVSSVAPTATAVASAPAAPAETMAPAKPSPPRPLPPGAPPRPAAKPSPSSAPQGPPPSNLRSPGF